MWWSTLTCPVLYLIHKSNAYSPMRLCEVVFILDMIASFYAEYDWRPLSTPPRLSFHTSNVALAHITHSNKAGGSIHFAGLWFIIKHKEEEAHTCFSTWSNCTQFHMNRTFFLGTVHSNQTTWNLGSSYSDAGLGPWCESPLRFSKFPVH